MSNNSIQFLALDFIENKNNTTFTKLINRLKPGLLTYSYKYLKDKDLCEEVVSQTFISVWEKLEQYNSKYNFSTWVYAIARNESLGILSKRKKQYSHEQLTENHSRLLKASTPTVTMDTEAFAPSGEELLQVVYEKTIEEIHSLPDPYKQVLIERELNQKQLKDISEELGWKLSTVKTRLTKAKKDLACNMREKHGDLLHSYYYDED